MNSNYNVWIKEFDKQGKQSNESIVTWLNNGVFTTKDNVNYISFIIKKGTNNASISVSEFDNINPYLCELDKEIHLRSLPKGVRDELNLQTGEYIQRIGEVVLDGSEAWKDWESNENYFKCSLANYPTNMYIDGQHNARLICDKLKVMEDRPGVVEDDFIASVGHEHYTIIIGMKFDNIATKDGEGFKQWLRENKPRIQYQLATPIVKQIDINNFPHSYKDGHVIIESNDPSTNVTAQMAYQCVANRTGQIQEHTEQVEKQEHEINELEMLILENIRQQQNR